MTIKKARRRCRTRECRKPITLAVDVKVKYWYCRDCRPDLWPEKLTRPKPVRTNLSWPPIIAEAKRIAESYDTDVTLRQLFYRLVSAQLIPNTQSKYTYLSSQTAEARRDGTFPDLIDNTREIHGGGGRFDNSPADALQEALEDAVEFYSRNHTEGQDVSIFLGVEKRGTVAQLQRWFGDYDFPILALGGYASQSYVRDVVRAVESYDRPAVLLYAGDHDPSGWDIPRDFVERTNCWKEVKRVALTPEQVAQYELPEAFGKEKDTRKTGFVRRFGKNVQVELDALPPDVLRQLYADAIGKFWDTSKFDAVMAREDEEREELERLVDELVESDDS